MPSSTAHIDLDAIAHNAATLSGLAGEARLCAVVKADGYGHGAVPAAEAARAGGASWLAVAQVDEARTLRAAGVDSPLLVLSEPLVDEIDDALTIGVDLVVYRPETIERIAERVVATGAPPAALHLKIDTGMQRVGCRPADAVGIGAQVVAHPSLRLAGTMTHLARADELDVATTDLQLDVFDSVLGDLHGAGIDPGLRHAANSAGTIAVPRARYDLVRSGIALYGIPPDPSLAAMADLRPALRWTSTVSLVKTVAAGSSVSYGHRHTFDADTVVATVPVGYADGLRRRLGLVGGCVLIGGRRCPIVGVVTMDQCVVDCGPDARVAVGDEVVLIGEQGTETITADDVAGLLDTIGYEVVCDLSPRVARSYVRGRPTAVTGGGSH